MWKKVLALAMVLSLLLCAVSSAEIERLTDEPITLKMLASVYSLQSDWDEQYIWKKMEELTGIHVEWDQVPMSSFAERRNVLLATNDLPDAIFKAGMNMTLLSSYGAEGTLVDFGQYLDSMPNYSALLELYPELKRAQTSADGNMYGVPYVGELLSPRISSKLFINKVWLDRVNMEMPTTTEEFHSVLLAFRDMDANGNDDATDEIPFGGLVTGLLSALKGSFGIGTRGLAHANVDTDADGNLRYIPTSDGYRELLGFLHELYVDNLLDSEMFTSTTQSFSAKGETNAFGSFAQINHTFVGTQYMNDFEGIPAALIGPNGDQLYTAVNPMVYTPGAFVITKLNQYPEETARWIDNFYGDEGMKLLFLGEENVTYTTDENGKHSYTDLINANPDGLSIDQAQSKYMVWTGGGNPSIVRENFFFGPATLPVAMQATENLAPYIPDTFWESFAFNDEEREFMNSFGSDMQTYVTEMQAKFITGDASLEDDWDSYVSTLEGIGLEEFMTYYGAAMERYLNS